MNKKSVNKEPLDEMGKGIQNILLWSLALIFLLPGFFLFIISLELIELPLLTPLAMTRIIAGIVLLVGTARLIYTIRSFNQRKNSLGFAIGVFDLVLGSWLLFNPSVRNVFLSLILILLILSVGIIEILLASQKRNSSNWYWLVFSGVVTINLSILLWFKFPYDIYWLLGWFVRLSLLAVGLYMLILAMYISRD